MGELIEGLGLLDDYRQQAEQAVMTAGITGFVLGGLIVLVIAAIAIYGKDQEIKKLRAEIEERKETDVDERLRRLEQDRQQQ